MKNVIITGTNGMIGKLVLEDCLKREDVNMITSITRKPSGTRHKRFIEVIHNDFLNYSKIETHLKGQDVCFFCIGVYTGQVSTDEFKKITVSYTKAFSEELKLINPGLSFCFLSGKGADPSGKSSLLFAREKGIAENNLLSVGFKHTYIFRPGYIYPDTPRKEPNVAYKIMRSLYKPISVIYPDFGVRSTILAKKMVDVGLHGGKKTIYENKDIRE